MNKVKFILWTASFGLALAFTFTSCALYRPGERYATDQGCRWNYQLQHGAFPSEEVRSNAAVENQANPNCGEVLREAARMDR